MSSSTSETRPPVRSWTSRELDPTELPVIAELYENLGRLSLAERPEQVTPLVGRTTRRTAPIDGFLSLSTRGLEPGQFRITRSALDDLGELEAVKDTWTNPEAFPIHDSGVLSDIVRGGGPSVHLELRVDDDPVFGDRLSKFGSLVAIPLLDGGEPLNWAVFLRIDTDGFTLIDLEQRMLMSNLVGGTVRILRAKQEVRRAHDALHREVDRIAEIQRSFMPRSLPSLPGWTLAGRFETHGVAGGDLWTARELEDGRLALVVADASGHGPAATVMAAMTHAVFHSADCTDLEPGCIATKINRYLARWQVAGAFVTAMVGVLDPASGELSYALAGHPPALHRPFGVDHADDIRRLDAVGGPPLGILQSMTYETGRTRIEPGDTLVLATDGILEARSPEGRQLGEAGLIEAMLSCPGHADCTLRRIEMAVHAFEGDRHADDDQTLVVLHRNPPESRPGS
jgi:sigma-B regulation protein RsbU (phosphoserine phosphatase)